MTLVRLIGSATLALAVVAGAPMAAQKPLPVQVYKSATCGCCSVWVEHLRRSGFAPTSTNVTDLDAVKAKHGVPARGQSCHTALVGGYVIEGHVPAAEIHRLLKEKPAGVVGLAVPACPSGRRAWKDRTRDPTTCWRSTSRVGLLIRSQRRRVEWKSAAKGPAPRPHVKIVA